MSRLSDQLTGWALAATGAVLAIAAVATVILLSPLSPTAGAQTMSLRAVASSASTTVSARHTSIGTILVGPGGRTVYAYSRDSRNHDVCASVRGCLKTWPLLTVTGQLRAGNGVSRSRLSTIRVNGNRQVTYAGHPLYMFADDGGPAETSYVGTTLNGGSWPAVSPSGALIK